MLFWLQRQNIRKQYSLANIYSLIAFNILENLLQFKEQDMLYETADSILVKEGRVEITQLFHLYCIISQFCFYHNFMIIYTLKYMIIFLYYG